MRSEASRVHGCDTQGMTASDRYARQIALPGFGEQGQERLSRARVLVIGAGGLGSPVIHALAAAGVGALGIVDDDAVDLSNLHRQVIHGTLDVGREKVASAADAVRALNPDVVVHTYAERLTAANALDLFTEYELVLDGSDNFPTRYLACDAAVLRGIPLVWGAVSQYAGQVGVSWPGDGPSYRDLFPVPAPPGTVLSCADGGVLPTVVGVIGSLMATEALGILTGRGAPLVGRVLVFDALTMRFREISYARSPEATPITGLGDESAPRDAIPTIDARSLAAMDADGITLIDVREPWEVEIAALPGAVLIPLGTLEEAVGTSLADVDRRTPMVAFCHHGVRSERACDILRAAGFEASSLAGGIDAWSRTVDASVARY